MTQSSLTPNRYSLSFLQAPTPQIEDILYQGLSTEAYQAKGHKKIERFTILVHEKNETIVGGITGSCLYGCLQIDILWIMPALRHQGWGTRLVEEAQKIGKEQHCAFATVQTMDWEALLFFQKLEFQIEFVRDGYAKQSKQYFLKKKLILQGR